MLLVKLVEYTHRSMYHTKTKELYACRMSSGVRDLRVFMPRRTVGRGMGVDDWLKWASTNVKTRRALLRFTQSQI